MVAVVNNKVVAAIDVVEIVNGAAVEVVNVAEAELIYVAAVAAVNVAAVVHVAAVAVINVAELTNQLRLLVSSKKFKKNCSEKLN